MLLCANFLWVRHVIWNSCNLHIYIYIYHCVAKTFRRLTEVYLDNSQQHHSASMMQNCFFDADQETLFAFMHCNQLERLSIKNATWAAVHLNNATRFSLRNCSSKWFGVIRLCVGFDATWPKGIIAMHHQERPERYYWMIAVWGKLAARRLQSNIKQRECQIVIEANH
jgi:hypothetical protein